MRPHFLFNALHTVSALVVEDAAPARRKLTRLLDGLDWIELVGEAADGESAVRRIDRLDPDLVLLDVRLPGRSGLEVLKRTRRSPHVIFTTAHDEYAVTAFELHALDYVQKPFSRRRLTRALERARVALGHRRTEDGPTREAAGRSALRERAREALRRGPVERIFVRRSGRVVPLRVRDIVWLEARGDYVALHTSGDRRFLVRTTLSGLVEHLGRERFLGIHRSRAVNLAHVLTFDPADGSRLRVRLSDGSHVMARRRLHAFLRRKCGLVDRDNPCRCHRRVGHAVEKGRVDPDDVLFAGAAAGPEPDAPVTKTLEAVEALRREAEVLKTNPTCESPRDLAAELSSLLDEDLYSALTAGDGDS